MKGYESAFRGTARCNGYWAELNLPLMNDWVGVMLISVVRH